MEPASSERPRLRPIEAFAVPTGEETQYCLRDPSGDSEETLVLSEGAMWLVARLDGTRDVGDLQADLFRSTGEIVPRSSIEELIVRLEAASFLDSPAFRERRRKDEEAFADSPRRPAAFAGKAYDADPAMLAAWIDALVDSGRGAPGGPARALIAPHIDPRRGAAVYGSAYRALAGHPAGRIVVLGISHAGGEIPYALIAKDFETPLGDCRVDIEFIERLRVGLPFDPLEGERLHRREHSIEFQALFLRHVLRDWDHRRIVPILCCFPWLPPGAGGAEPYPARWRELFVDRLASLLDDDALIVAGVDFAHVGRRFGDAPGGVQRMREAVERADRAMMAAIADGDAAAFADGIARDGDARRICGYPALVTLQGLLPAARGDALDYGQAVDESIDSLVSFGAMVLR